MWKHILDQIGITNCFLEIDKGEHYMNKFGNTVCLLKLAGG